MGVKISYRYSLKSANRSQNFPKSWIFLPVVLAKHVVDFSNFEFAIFNDFFPNFKFAIIPYEETKKNLNYLENEQSYSKTESNLGPRSSLGSICGTLAIGKVSCPNIPWGRKVPNFMPKYGNFEYPAPIPETAAHRAKIS